jgi:hypothetical protein
VENLQAGGASRVIRYICCFVLFRFVLTTHVGTGSTVSAEADFYGIQGARRWTVNPRGAQLRVVDPFGKSVHG